MYFAAIAPITRLKDIEENAVHMALAHLCDNEVYANFYREQVKQGKFVILDNSVIELKKAVSPDELLEAAGKIGAHEIIVPDAFNDASATVNLARSYIPKVKGKGYRIMAVAHGTSVPEWLWCAQQLISLGIDTLGVPKVLVKNLGPTGRVQCLRALTRVLTDPSKVPALHLLGIWDDPLEIARIYLEEAAGHIYRIRSCDSAIAYVYASYGYFFGEGARPNSPVNFTSGNADGYIHMKNLMHMRQLCGDSMRLTGLDYEFDYKEPNKIIKMVNGVIKVDFGRK